MTDSIITAYSQGGQSFLDAESVTTTVGQGMALRQRVQVSVRDITSGASTEVGDAANQAIRVNVVQGSFSVSSNPNVTITALGPNFPVVTVSGITSNPNVTVTTLGSSFPVVTISGTVTATGVTIQQATVTQGTTPWTVSYSQGTQAVTFTAPTFFPLPATMSSQWPATTTFLPVTFTNPTVTFSAGTQSVTFSAGTQAVTTTQLLVSATQGTNPWTVTLTTLPVTVSGVAVVTFSQGTQAVTFSTGTQTVTFSQGTQIVSFSAGTQAVTFSAGTSVVSATQGTNPWTVTLSGVGVVTFSAGTQPVTQSGSTWLVTATQGTNPWTVTYSQGVQAVTFSAGVQPVTFSGPQPVTVTAILQQTIDEQGNLVQRTDQQSLFEAMTIELRAIRLGMQYLVAQMTEAAGSQLDLHESAKELFDSEEVSH